MNRPENAGAIGSTRGQPPFSRSLRVLALLLTAITLIPGGAHLFELPGKIDLDRDAYFIVQGIYAGWAYFAFPILAAILANGMLYFVLRRSDPGAARWALVSAVLIIASLAVFFIWVFPANQATANWTMPPAAWARLRMHWEYGHAAGAMLVLLALFATVMASVRR